MNEKISVVVPVYKTEKYLENAVKSLLSQTYQNLEIILVDDGSPDHCGEICDRLAVQDERIRVLHKSNGGVSRARFDGICQAVGEYVTFIDSDDTVDPDYVETLYQAIHEFDADAATCAHRMLFDNGQTREEYGFSDGVICLSPQETIHRVFHDSCCSTALCCKLFRTAWLREIAPSALALGEDSYICLLYFLRSRRLAHTGKCLYTYYQREDSAVHSSGGERYYDYVRLYDMLLPVFQTEMPQCLPDFYYRLVEKNIVVYLKIMEDPSPAPEKIKHIADNIQKYKTYALKDKQSHLRTKIACVLSSFGLQTVDRVYSLVSHLKK